MSDLIINNLGKIIAVIAIFEFEFVLIYRRRYLKKDTRPNFILMVMSIVIFMDAFLYTVLSFSNISLFTMPMAGLIRFAIHCIALVFFMGYYFVTAKTE